ncbi:hypothetical protein FE257_011409 [Aspergillus nanangensis]|uniref:GST N-terminal domain-containing protein n=1 Tax=Aspergillus nanangensis TaxID=2582783 RepID=A0AAD4CJ24_ASPNN|nr:hypothetical protein FE257_011409 [Aspergillus nanangensis]
MATPSNPLVYYDVAMRPPATENACAVNPWKGRLALNFKNVPYTTTWVPLPDITKVRQGLGIPAGRKFADGSDFYTLPIMEDPANNHAKLGDSFDIAVYLQKTYPNSGAGDLFPPQTIDYAVKGDVALLIPLSERQETDFPEYARFNTNVDAAFTAHVGLMAHGMPLDPATAHLTKAEFVRRAGVQSWEDFNMVGEMRQKTKDSFRDTLGDLAELFTRDASGPFLLGSRASYADLIVGGWLQMARVTLPAAEWEELRSWHDGVFARLYDAQEKYREVK